MDQLEVKATKTHSGPRSALDHAVTVTKEVGQFMVDTARANLSAADATKDAALAVAKASKLSTDSSPHFGSNERCVLPFARGRMLLENLAACAVIGSCVHAIVASCELSS